MYSEPFYEGVHYVKEDTEFIEREVAPLSERLLNQNLWQGTDWYYYYQGQKHGDLGINSCCDNPFYMLGYNKAQEKYRS